MSFIQYLNEEKFKLVLSSLTTAIGFFLALFASSAVDHYQEKEAYYSMLKAIQVEAQSNESVLHESFEKYFDKGIVLQEFSISFASQSLLNTTFLKYSAPSEVAKLSVYVRTLTLANKYRDRAEKFRLADNQKAWLDRLIPIWATNLEACAKSITAASNINNE